MLKRSVAVSAVLAVVVTLASTPVVAGDGRKSGQIDGLMSRFHELRLFNGSVLVAQDGELLFQKGYGLANMEWGIPNTPETRFRLGSITKQFTSMLVMQMVERGELKLDATLADLLPYYRKDTGARITLHNLLNHTSGLPNYTSQPGFVRDVSRDPSGVEDFVTGYCSGDLEFEPGSRFRYSNSGYFLLGAILEHATGEAYAKLLQERILDPAGMRSTGYDLAATILPKRAAGYERTPGGYRNADYLDMSLPYSAGAMYSTVGDLFLWDRALYDGTLLGPDATKTMFTPGMGDYAYGWRVQQQPLGPDGAERTVVGHGGGINGFNTVIERIVDDEHLVVLLNNTGGTALGPMAGGIREILYGREPDEPQMPISDLLYETTMKSGVDAAIAQYRTLREGDAEASRSDQRQLNRLGYQLLGAGEVDAALAIFKMNVELFPESANPHDSLGEALAAAGRTEEAIKSYARSLELDPGNRNAAERLMQLVREPASP